VGSLRSWRAFDTANWENSDCCPFEMVHHTCHVADAFRMFEGRKIRSSLIWDESRLNNTRTCVAWLSPNHWTNGSLYGNINFHFDWRDLVAGKRSYWVEAIKSYRPPAFRILITAKDPGSGLQPYPDKCHRDICANVLLCPRRCRSLRANRGKP
jgi:hypothetical protein